MAIWPQSDPNHQKELPSFHTSFQTKFIFEQIRFTKGKNKNKPRTKPFETPAVMDPIKKSCFYTSNFLNRTYLQLCLDFGEHASGATMHTYKYYKTVHSESFNILISGYRGKEFKKLINLKVVGVRTQRVLRIFHTPRKCFT